MTPPAGPSSQVAGDRPASGGTGERHRVVIVGGGFGGLPAARYLGGKPVDVTLVDRRNYHLFQPLLYQTATGMISPGQIAPALRHVVRREKNVTVQLAAVVGFDLDRKVVHAVVARAIPVEFPYDSLIVATGAGQSYFGHDELAFYAPGMKTLDDALELRRRIFGAFEMAELTDDPTEKMRWLTFVVIGAGPTGVELAGQIRELAVRSLRGEFRTFSPDVVRVILVDGGDAPLAGFGERLSGKVATTLVKLGIDLRMGARVVGVDNDGVDVQKAARWTGRGGSRSCPTSPFLGTPRCSPSGTWPRSTTCPVWPRWRCRVASTPPTPSSEASRASRPMSSATGTSGPWPPSDASAPWSRSGASS
jgi:NADH:ubiquinone reductase (H+-translocating)